jgi:hypothetical protein
MASYIHKQMKALKEDLIQLFLRKQIFGNGSIFQVLFI